MAVITAWVLPALFLALFMQETKACPASIDDFKAHGEACYAKALSELGMDPNAKIYKMSQANKCKVQAPWYICARAAVNDCGGEAGYAGSDKQKHVDSNEGLMKWQESMCPKPKLRKLPAPAPRCLNGPEDCTGEDRGWFAMRGQPSSYVICAGEKLKKKVDCPANVPHPDFSTGICHKEPQARSPCVGARPMPLPESPAASPAPRCLNGPEDCTSADRGRFAMRGQPSSYVICVGEKLKKKVDCPASVPHPNLSTGMCHKEPQPGRSPCVGARPMPLPAASPAPRCLNGPEDCTSEDRGRFAMRGQPSSYVICVGEKLKKKVDCPASVPHPNLSTGMCHKEPQPGRSAC